MRNITDLLPEFKEMPAVETIDRLIEGGRVDLYPLKALVASAASGDPWKINDFDLFRKILLEGIDNGCLAPDMDAAWNILDRASESNDPALFMDDTERFYDILATAVEEGNYTALDIMNLIWEPEQIIEED